jgi:hypothetical protein
MRKVVLGGLVVVVAVLVTAVAVLFLWPAAPDRKPLLADSPPLQTVTRTSVVIAPAAVALAAIRDAMEAKAPRDLTGKRENPIGQLLQNAELGWTITRGPLALTGRPEGLNIVAPLNGTFRLTGQIGAQLGSGVGTITGALGGVVNEQLGKQMGSLTGRMLDQRADMRGNVTLTARPAILPNWRLEPNLTGQANIGDANLSVAGARLNLSREVKPLIDRAVGEQVGALQARLRGDPFIEQIARREWAKLCRSISLGKVAAGVPDLWLEVRPVRAVAAQPRIDASAVTLTLGVQAETRITPAESKPDCPFPGTVELVPPLEQGRVAIVVPIDVPFTEVNKLIEAQLKGRMFPENGSGPADVTVQRASVAASGDRLLITLRVKAKEKKSWFGFGAEATVHVWGKPVLDRAQQVLRLTEIELDVESESAFGLLGTAARAAVPYLKDALAENARIDLKPFAANARKSIEAAIADFRQSGQGVQVDAAVTDLRLVGIEYDAKTLRVIAEADGTVKVAISALPAQ